MPSKNKNVRQNVLRALEESRSEAACISGARLAEDLCVSRTAVWKAIEELRQEGYAITAAKQGYSLSADSDVLSIPGVAACLRHRELSDHLHLYETLESTNLTAKQMVLSGAPHGTVVIASTQTMGRGRLGRSFFSPKDTGVYFSMVLRPRSFPSPAASENPVLMTTAAAVAISRAIEQVSGRSVQIKWVNDLYLNEKKICGILTEGIVDLETSSIDAMIVGVGINCFPPENDFPEELRGRAASLFFSGEDRAFRQSAPEYEESGETNHEQSPCFSKNALIAASIDCLTDIQSELADCRFLNEYRRRSFVLGKEICFYPGGIPTSKNAEITAGRENRGTAIAIDDQGGLVVRLADGSEQTLATGEISVRTIEDK